jgi:hypothetical protein
MTIKNLVSDDLASTSWLGEIVDIKDPQKIGRVKIRVFGKFDLIPIEDIPWAYPANNMTAGSSSGGGFFSVPKLGSIVSVRFDNGNLYHPEYYFIQKISEEAKTEIENSYENAHIIVYDTVTSGGLKIFFTEEKGLMLDYQETRFNIKNDKSVIINTASGNSEVELLDDGKMNIIQSSDITIKSSTKVIIDQADVIELGEGATERVILGDSFTEFFNNHIHIGNMGAPTSPPSIPSTPILHLSGNGDSPKTLVK